jgi:hypothetical protein
MHIRTKKFLAWLWVGLCTLSILIIVPLARAIQRFVSTHGGRALFGYAVIGATAVAFCALIYVLFFHLKIRSVSQYVWLVLIAAFYIYYTLRLWNAPEEAVHFLEYGLLGFFLFRALSFTTQDKSIYFAAFFAGSLVGICDEIFQWAVPGRYWDLRDVGLNALAAGLFQVALWKGVKPRIINQAMSAKSVQKASILLGANLLLLGICLSNTPNVVAWYTRIFPKLAFLQKEEAMSEFRYKHKDPEIGVFYSRLSLEELKRGDAERAEDYGRRLNEWKDKKYDDFLRTFTGSTHPFLYELRIHLFRRDRKYKDVMKAADEAQKKNLLFIAYKENLIAQKYFRRTLNRSVYEWPKEKIEEIKAQIDPSIPYNSPVGSGPLATLKIKTMWLSIAIVLAVLAILNILLRRSQHHQFPPLPPLFKGRYRGKD